MAKKISKHEQAYLARLSGYSTPPSLGAVELCARRMERTLNSPPRHGKTRAYVATLPKRAKPVRVTPEEYQRCKEVAVRHLAAKIVAVEAAAINRAHDPVRIAFRQDRIRPRARIEQAKPYRDRLFEVQDGICGGCGFLISFPREGTLDHVVPRALGGSNALSNLLLMHADCNNRKADRPPNQFELERNRLKNERLGMTELAEADQS